MTQWFLDFDDTLASGPISWTLENVLPKFIRAHNLPMDQAQLDETILLLLEAAARGLDAMELMSGLFSIMDWPTDLMEPLLHEAFDQFRPTLFEDTIPFLQAAGSVYVISNNNRAPKVAEQLGIAPYIKAFFTPKLSGAAQGKPARDLWDIARASCDTEGAVLVGDDPWSDGVFAATCGLDYFLVDRADRYKGMSQFRRVRSLMAVLDACTSAVQP